MAPYGGGVGTGGSLFPLAIKVQSAAPFPPFFKGGLGA